MSIILYDQKDLAELEAQSRLMDTYIEQLNTELHAQQSDSRFFALPCRRSKKQSENERFAVAGSNLHYCFMEGACIYTISNSSFLLF